MRALELLAPARTAVIGFAAVDCGADAVYIAGPAFGARQAAGNPVADIRRLPRPEGRAGDIHGIGPAVDCRDADVRRPGGSEEFEISPLRLRLRSK